VRPVWTPDGGNSEVKLTSRLPTAKVSSRGTKTATTKLRGLNGTAQDLGVVEEKQEEKR